MRAVHLVLLVALLAAGCLSDAGPTEPEEPVDDASTAEQRPTNGTQDADEDRGDEQARSNGTEEGSGTEPAGNRTGEANGTEEHDPGWPPLEEATIRPGVGNGEMSLGGQESHSCTSNFLFASPDNATLYLGTAAHCIDDGQPGDTVDVAQGEATAEIAYAGWWDAENETWDSDHGQDFALLALPDEARNRTHPALLGHGGPTGLADPTGLAPMDEIRWYANASWRADQDPLQENEGFVCEASDGSSPVHAHTVPSAGPGDSGSPVLTADGRAVGPLVGASFVVCPSGSYAERIVPLAAALEEARQRGTDVELVTWPLLDGSGNANGDLRSL